MIPEKEREALMRLTMCARHDCIEEATKNMHILADALERKEE